MDLRKTVEHVAWRVGVEAQALHALRRAGMIERSSPRDVLTIVQNMRRYGSFGSATALASLRHGDRTAVVDDFGSLTFSEMDERVNRLANAWHAQGIGPGSTVGILCRNHAGPLICAFAAARLGTKGVWLNTSFAPPQVRDVARREGVETLVADEDLVGILSETEVPGGVVVTATEDRDGDELAKLIDSGSAGPPPAPPRPGKVILLTSGTTGTPKGAPRSDPRGLSLPGALLERMPMKARETTVIGPPLFHGTGLAIGVLAIGLGSTLILRRRWSPEQCLDDLAEHRATGLCVVPVMLQRMLALGEDEVRRRDLSHLRVVFCAGSQLPGELSTKAMDLLGDVIYNLYGSTEVSLATMATPADLRAAPGTTGKPMLGARIKLLDEQGREVPKGETGRIFVGTATPFEGYTGGGSKEVVDGLMSTGDVGHFDAEGRLFIDGRDDEMIVSGGENVFPREVEELLVTHAEIEDAAAIGVEDEGFGQRLRAFVVRRPGSEIDAEGVQQFVRENLARYKIPRDVVFVDELPRNPTGKILKRELAQREV